MDPLILARWQFGVTTVYHFFFVPLTMGLAVLIALMETQYVRTGKEEWRRATKFWGKLFLINFAIGIATGIVQEFQFGMNWSEYSRFVGDVFGAPLAIEALTAFFLESTFLGIWIFGWNTISKKLHLAAIWLVALGSNLSAIFILSANSWMHNPVGYVIRNGRAEMDSFLALLTNPYLWMQFPHVFFASLTTGSFFVMGISAYHLLRKGPDHEIFTKTLRLSLVVGLVAALGVAGTGHRQAQILATVNPMKLAAAEALYETANPAALSLFSVIDEKGQREVFSIRIPAMLSFLVYNKPEGEVKGIKDLQIQYERRYGPGNYIPPVTITYFTFRIMVGAGTLLILLGFLTAFWVFLRKKDPPPLLLKALMWAIALPFIANSTGWILTEMGRQPWVVQGLLRTEHGVSIATTGGQVLFSLVAFTLLYAVLMAVTIFLMRKYIRLGLPGQEA